jgi:hypothetical protein
VIFAGDHFGMNYAVIVRGILRTIMAGKILAIMLVRLINNMLKTTIEIILIVLAIWMFINLPGIIFALTI